MGQDAKEEIGFKWLWGFTLLIFIKDILVPMVTAYTASFTPFK